MALRLGPGRVKQLSIKSLHAQETIANEGITLLAIATADNSADLGTKALPFDVHVRHCRRLGSHSNLFYKKSTSFAKGEKA